MDRPVKVALVPGHSPGDPGAGCRGVHEYPVALSVLQMVKERLGPVPGLDGCMMLRNDAGGLPELVEHINALNVDGVLSLHFNAVEDTEIRPHGYAIVHPDASPEARSLARYVSIEVPAPGGTRQGYRTRSELAILRDTSAPVVLDEPFFIDRTDAQIAGLEKLDVLAGAYVRTLRRWARWEAGPLGGSSEGLPF